ncbi:hypothetical protein SCOR_07400 [Sulfidibacter corallicola]|uniref:Uncharacterized protein n=1 Tax=Sulfidibacter corallicola TaxID=2818388 RepID=A0A8A4TR13_SULCO|nr:hypothetical protein [Sulfidibacter corallicola]QTD51411.1 hypothetical protein J3U87_02985 [Sulfidibacter corallicola]
MWKASRSRHGLKAVPRGSGFSAWCHKVPLMLLVALGWGISFAGEPLVLEDARFKGNFGCRFTVGDSVNRFVGDNSRQDLSSLSVRFYVQLADLNLGNGSTIVIFSGVDTAGEAQFMAQVRGSAEGLELVLRARLDDDNFAESTGAPLIDTGWQALNLEWTAADGTGSFRAMLNGTEVQALADLTNSATLIDIYRMGKMSEAGAGNGGFVEMDDFSSRTVSTIGLLCLTPTELNGFYADWPDRNILRHINLLGFQCPEEE